MTTVSEVQVWGEIFIQTCSLSADPAQISRLVNKINFISGRLFWDAWRIGPIKQGIKRVGTWHLALAVNRRVRIQGPNELINSRSDKSPKGALLASRCVNCVPVETTPDCGFGRASRKAGVRMKTQQKHCQAVWSPQGRRPLGEPR